MNLQQLWALSLRSEEVRRRKHLLRADDEPSPPHFASVGEEPQAGRLSDAARVMRAASGGSARWKFSQRYSQPGGAGICFV